MKWSTTLPWPTLLALRVATAETHGFPTTVVPVPSSNQAVGCTNVDRPETCTSLMQGSYVTQRVSFVHDSAASPAEGEPKASGPSTRAHPLEAGSRDTKLTAVNEAPAGHADADVSHRLAKDPGRKPREALADAGSSAVGANHSQTSLELRRGLSMGEVNSSSVHGTIRQLALTARSHLRVVSGGSAFTIGFIAFLVILVCCVAACSRSWFPKEVREPLQPPSPTQYRRRKAPVPAVEHAAPWEPAPPRSSSKRAVVLDGPPVFNSESSAKAPEERTAISESLHLSPELVVPEGNECTLLVPAGCLASGKDSVSISDARGVPVFKAALFRSRPSDSTRLVLSSVSGGAIFGSCVKTPGGFSILHRTDSPFATLRAEGATPASGYVVSARTGLRVCFRGDPESRNVNATDESGRLLAIVEEHGSAQRSIRIGPHVDAGLMVLSTLGIDLLILHPSRTPTPEPRQGR